MRIIRKNEVTQGWGPSGRNQKPTHRRRLVVEILSAPYL